VSCRLRTCSNAATCDGASAGLSRSTGWGFHIGAGETYGLLGPNGAGKTTTISMIAGLLECDGGMVTVDGEPMTTRSVRAKSAIGYVPQDLAIYPDLSGRENLMFFARLYAMPTAEARRRAAEVLTLTGLTERAGDQAKLYSGGMKRRLNMAGRSWVRQARAVDGGIDLVVENARSELPVILSDVAAGDVAVRSVEVTEPDLEAVFLHLTGRAGSVLSATR